MEFWNFWLPLIGVGAFLAIGISAWFADHKITGLWFGFVGCVCILLLATLQIQNSLQETEPVSPETIAQRILAAAQAASQRAWLTIVPHLTSQIRAGSAIDIELITENVGKEPAIGVSHHGVAMMFEMPEQIGYAPEIWSSSLAEIIKLECGLAVPVRGHVTIFPGNKPTIPARWDNLQDVQALIDSKKILVLYGCVGYLTSGQDHYTTYCLFLMRDKKSGAWHFGSAPIGNDAT